MNNQTDQENIDQAFEHWWRRLGRDMPRPRGAGETDEEYRKRTAHCAFILASACLLYDLDDFR